MKCDCGKMLAPIPSHGIGKYTIGISCECGIYWDIHHGPDKLYGTFVRWKCEVCGSSKQICKNAPPISKCYRGPDMKTKHLRKDRSSRA